MSRRLRPQAAGLTQHVIHRGNNRCDVFRSERDYLSFLCFLGEAATHEQVDVHVYTLMTNHIHVILTPRVDGAVSKTMRTVGSNYVRYFNRRHSRTGTLFGDRFKSLIIDTDDYFLKCMRYVELNPVRARMVADPSEYRWSSYQRNALGLDNELIVPHPLYVALGPSDGLREHSWRAICQEDLAPEQLADMRHLVHHEARTSTRSIRI
jgi:putative transposase